MAFVGLPGSPKEYLLYYHMICEKAPIPNNF